MRRKPSPKRRTTTSELFGSGAEYATPEEMEKLLDELREQDK